MLKLRKINKSYIVGWKSQQVLFDIDFDINPGDYTAIMGRSGSGKSTFMNIVGMIDNRDSGTYIFDDVDIANIGESKRADIRGSKIWFVFQSYNLISKLPVWYQVSLPLFYKWISASERRRLAEIMLEKVWLADMLDKLPNQLSGWQQQRVAIARAIISEPEFILADEPTGALDTVSSNQVMDIFDRLNKEGKTIVMITHDDEVAKRAKKTVYLKDGKIVDSL